MKIEQSKLFFILAPPRSGTSLLQSLMNTFSGFCNLEESRIAGRNSPFCWLNVIRDGDFSYLEKFIEKNWTKEYFVEKSPPSINCLPEILERFPDANYIFLERNPTKIIKSILNLNLGYSHVGRRKYDIDTINDDVNILKFEESEARKVLNMINLQVKYKPKFRNQITIKFENLTESLESNLLNLEKTFGIISNRKKAIDCLKKPSRSSNFRYGYDKITSKKAIAMINLASNLWNYI